MSKQSVPTNVLDQARLILRVWQEKDPNMVFGKMTLQEFSDSITDADQGDADAESAVAVVGEKRGTRHKKRGIAWNNVKRQIRLQEHIWRRLQRIRAHWRHSRQRSKEAQA